jgi:hypothetical protein
MVFNPMVINAPAESNETLPFIAWKQYRTLVADDARNPNRWMGGVIFRSTGCVFPDGVELGDPCADPERETAEGWDLELADGDVADHRFSSFGIDASAFCPSVGGWGYDRLVAYVNQRTELIRSVRLAAQVERGLYTSDATPFLADSPTDVSTADVTPVGALANVEEGLATKLGVGRGMIHLTLGLATRLRGALVFDETGAKTVSGHTVIVDPGYVGASPSTNAAVAGEQWIYGSGMVAYRASDLIIQGTRSDSFDIERNVQHVTARLAAVAAFEPCSVVAARVDTTP